MTQILKLKHDCTSVLFILNSLLSHDNPSCFYKHLEKFEMILSSLISVKFKLNKMSETNLMTLKLVLKQSV